MLRTKRGLLFCKVRDLLKAHVKSLANISFPTKKLVSCALTCKLILMLIPEVKYYLIYKVFI